MILNQVCSIYRSEKVKNSYGQVTKTWSLLEEDIPCNIQYALVSSGNLNQTPTGQVGFNEYIGFFYPGQDILLGDKVVWYNITLYIKTINPVFTVSGSTPHHIEVLFGYEEN